MINTDIHSIVRGVLPAPPAVSPALGIAIAASCDTSTTYLYNYTSVSVQTPVAPASDAYSADTNSNVTVAATVLLSCLGYHDELNASFTSMATVAQLPLSVYDLQIESVSAWVDDVAVSQDSSTTPDLSLPFRFVRDVTGTVLGVIYDSAEDSSVLAIKKAIAEVFNTNLAFNANGTTSVTEAGLSAVRVADYAAVLSDSSLVVASSYNQDSVSVWAANSSLDSAAYSVESKAVIDVATGVLQESYDRTSITPGTNATDAATVAATAAGPIVAHLLSSDAVLVSKLDYQPNSAPLPSPLADSVVPLPYALAATGSSSALRRRSPDDEAVILEEATNIVDVLSSTKKDPTLASQLTARLAFLAREEPNTLVPFLLDATDPRALRRRDSAVPPYALISALAASAVPEALHRLVELIRDEPSSQVAEAARSALIFVPVAPETVVDSTQDLVRSDPRTVLALGALLSHRPRPDAEGIMRPVVEGLLDSTHLLDSDHEQQEDLARALLAIGNMGQNAAPLAPLLADVAADGRRAVRVRLAAVVSLRQALADSPNEARDGLAVVLAAVRGSAPTDVRVRQAALAAAVISAESSTADLPVDSLDATVAAILYESGPLADERTPAIRYCRLRLEPCLSVLGNNVPALASPRRAIKQQRLSPRDLVFQNVTVLYVDNNWDSVETPSYNLIEDLTTREADSTSFTNHSSILLGNLVGWDSFNVQAAAGAFGGAAAAATTCPIATPSFKTLARARMVATAFGNSVDLLDADVTAAYTQDNATSTAKTLAASAYIIVLGKTLSSEALAQQCDTQSFTLVGPVSLPALQVTYAVPVYAATVTLTAGLQVSYTATANFAVCAAPSASLGLRHALTLSASGSAGVSVVLAGASLVLSGSVDLVAEPMARALAATDPACSVCADLEVGHGPFTVGFSIKANVLGISTSKNLYSWTLGQGQYEPVPGIGGCASLV
ncbi:hypothetical protein HK405_009330 [Cladochytrium tenue]|nr:hypothetical protein HK405_009330 [Cladochytrium tenue]